jgi:hypothetical protein
MTRVTVPVRQALRKRVREHPEEFGLPPGLSETRAFANLIEVGARVLFEERRDLERAVLYAEWADDLGRRESVRKGMEIAIRDGVL